MNINIMGLGKLGFPMACFLGSKHSVKCFDINSKLRNILERNPESYLTHEFHINRYLKKKIKIFKTPLESLLGTDISFITVPTPSLNNQKFSNKFIIKTLDNIIYYIKTIKDLKKKEPYIININSTVSPGSFSNELIPYMTSKGLKINKDYHFVYNPYFVALGNVLQHLENPDFILIGHCSSKSIIKIKKIYSDLYTKPKFKFMNLEEAELVKLLVNSYVATKISFTNFVQEITNKFHVTSANKILEAVGTDKRIGKNFFNVGGPFMGPCLPRDMLALKKFCKEINIKPLLPTAANKINNERINEFYKTLNLIKNSKFKNIGFIGTGYKPNTDSVEESIAFKVMQRAKKLKFKVYYFDRFIKKNHKRFKRFYSIRNLVKKTDIIFISYKDNYINKIKKYFTNKNIIWDIFSIINSKKIRVFSNINEFKSIKLNHYN
jgi:UDPglucose 6-dehydrogenase